MVVTTFTPLLSTGRDLRTYALVRALARFGLVDLAYVVFGAPQPAPEYERIAGVRLHPIQASRGFRRGLTYARQRGLRVVKPYARGVSPELVATAKRLASAPQRGRVVADGLTAAAALMPLARRRPVIYNAHNVESAFRPAVEPGSWNPRTLVAFERRILERMAESWMVSPADMERARALAPGAALRYVPNVVDVDAIEPVPRRASSSGRLLFVADFTYAPNRLALGFLLEQVLPRVWEELPEARLTLVGRGLSDPQRLDERVDALGFVEDLRTAYAEADCAVVPLVQGGGSPLKFIEALAYGLPVVATPLAGAGLEARAGEHYLEAASADSFASAVVRVLRRGEAEIAARGRTLVERRYSIDALAEKLAP